MKIAIFTDIFYPRVDGISKRMKESIDRLVKKGHDILLVCPKGYTDNYEGIEIVTVPSYSSIHEPNLRLGIYSWKAIRKVKEFKPDVIHAVSPAFIFVGALGVKVGKKLGIPTLASYQTNYYNLVNHYSRITKPIWVRNLLWHFIKKVYNSADQVITTSYEFARQLPNMGILGNPEIKVWKKAVDSELFCPKKSNYKMRNKLTEGREGPLLIHVSRLAKEKNIGFLRDILDRLDGVNLAILGAGNHEKWLKNHFKGYPVSFPGVIIGDDLAEAYASSDVFVFASEFETLGFSVLESKASGIPVVCANAGGVKDIVNHEKSGFLYAPGDADSAASYVKLLLKNKDLRKKMGTIGRKEVTQFSWDAVADQLEEFYRITIESGKKSA